MPSMLSLPSTTEDAIFDHLSAATLLTHGRTCKAIHSQVRSYARRKFRLHKLLAAYFSPPHIIHLRQLQASTGMLISGSTALQFFDRAVYPESDLDLYVENTHNICEKIGRWLLEVGYAYIPHPSFSSASFIDDLNQIQEDRREVSPPAFIEPGPDHPAYHAQFVFTFSKNSENGGRKIQMIASEGPPLGSVLNFHSTCVMNILTYNTAYSFFPRATFEDRVALSSSDRKPNLNETALEKYKNRGWSIHHRITRADFKNPAFIFAPKSRYVGDAQCWKMPILPILLPNQPCCGDIESNSWRMNYSNDLVLAMTYEVVTSPHLQFSYLIESEDEDLTKQLETEINFESDEYEIDGPRPFLDRQLKGIFDRHHLKA